MPPAQIDPNEVLASVLARNKALATNYPSGSVSAIFAPAERVEALIKSGRGENQLEFWPPDETGSPDFPRPKGYDKQSVLEVYRPELQRNRKLLESAIYGDLLHGMDKDPYFAKLKQSFVSSYLPNISKWNEKLRARGQSQKSIDDMYIRGYLSPDERDEFRRGTHYSPQQLAILEKLRRYIATGVPER